MYFYENFLWATATRFASKSSAIKAVVPFDLNQARNCSMLTNSSALSCSWLSAPVQRVSITQQYFLLVALRRWLIWKRTFFWAKQKRCRAMHLLLYSASINEYHYKFNEVKCTLLEWVMACVQPSGLKKRQAPPRPGPDFLSSNMRGYHLVVRIKNFSDITKQLNFILAELKKSYIYLHCSKNNEFFFSFIYSSTHRNQTGTWVSGMRWPRAGRPVGRQEVPVPPAEAACEAWLTTPGTTALTLMGENPHTRAP